MKRPDWDTYFLNIAKEISKRSTCLRRQYGAVVVRDNKIISTGYNGAPRGIENCIDKGTCTRKELGVPPGERYELCEAVHAEQNAIINGTPDGMKEAKIYVAGFEYDGKDEGVLSDSKPCKLCDRMIKNAQLGEIIYLDSNGNIKKGF